MIEALTQCRIPFSRSRQEHMQGQLLISSSSSRHRNSISRSSGLSPPGPPDVSGLGKGADGGGGEGARDHLLGAPHLVRLRPVK